jgi:hypothetical protein
MFVACVEESRFVSKGVRSILGSLSSGGLDSSGEVFVLLEVLHVKSLSMCNSVHVSVTEHSEEVVLKIVPPFCVVISTCELGDAKALMS